MRVNSFCESLRSRALRWKLSNLGLRWPNLVASTSVARLKRQVKNLSSQIFLLQAAIPVSSDTNLSLQENKLLGM